jgi:hypothetical protein
VCRGQQKIKKGAFRSERKGNWARGRKTRRLMLWELAAYTASWTITRFGALERAVRFGANPTMRHARAEIPYD